MAILALYLLGTGWILKFTVSHSTIILTRRKTSVFSNSVKQLQRKRKTARTTHQDQPEIGSFLQQWLAKARNGKRQHKVCNKDYE